MSYCKEIGKDQVIFLTEEDAAKPSSVELPEPAPGETPQGLITESGEINWSCPCLGGMAVGPCGVEFREAFSCFHYSEAEPKGSDCFDKFVAMQECMKEYPELYDKSARGDDDDDELQLQTEVTERDPEEKDETSDEEKSTQLASEQNAEKVDRTDEKSAEQVVERTGDAVADSPVENDKSLETSSEDVKEAEPNDGSEQADKSGQNTEEVVKVDTEEDK